MGGLSWSPRGGARADGATPQQGPGTQQPGGGLTKSQKKALRKKQAAQNKGDQGGPRDRGDDDRKRPAPGSNFVPPEKRQRVSPEEWAKVSQAAVGKKGCKFFNTSKGCNNPKCSSPHTCFKCGGNHPMSKCRQR